ncbi:DNA repair protein RAD50.L-like [Tubulanus polymorphus]|uniref:DNA repair protein RAD50.L-like n=1 Tax=Tubulanus polymorphus TaxID=672921 RepID=UPI003DA50145
MSRIDFLAIQGIRSFGSHDKDRQTMKFYTPLTLILGPNGTGKTTIIECLKYLSTGEYPPGAKVNAAFVHDPKIANENEVRAKVGLEIRDVTGKRMTVTRKLVATQSAKQTKLRTLESTIKRQTPDGDWTSISSRCAEIDREMVASLGVSKAVLENVIFCHQEDSTWPLGEGKMVKQKFDDIFASTRYTKALDSIKDSKKKQDQILKECSIEIPHLRNYKKRSEELKKEVDELTTKTTATKDHIRKLDQQLEPLDEQLMKIQQQSSEIYRIQTEIEKLRGITSGVMSARNDLAKSITQKYDGTIAELKDEIEDFQSRVKTNENQLEKNELKLNSVQTDLDSLQNKQTLLFRDQGQLQQEAKQHEENVNKRNQRVQQLAEKHSFIGFDDVTDDDITSFVDKLRRKQQSLNSERDDLKNSFDSRESDIQLKIDEIRDEKVKHEQTECMNNKNIRINQDEIRDIKRQIQQASQSTARLQEIDDELSKTEEDLAKEENSVDLPALETEVKQLAEQRKLLSDKIKQLDNDLREMNKVAQQRSELESRQTQKQEVEKKVTTILRNHKDAIQNLLGNIDKSKIHEKLDELIKRLESDRNREKHKQDELNKKLSAALAQQTMRREQVEKLESEQQLVRRELETACGSQNVDNKLERVQTEINQSQDERGSLIGASHFFKKYMTELQQPNPCCPLCKRDFDEPEESQQLIETLQNKLKLVPSRMKQAETKLERLQNQNTMMLQLKPKQDRLKQIADNELRKLQDQLNELSANISKYTEEIEDCQAVIEARQLDLDEAKMIQPDVQQLPSLLRDIAQKDRIIEQYKTRLGDVGCDRSIDDVNSEKDRAQNDSDGVNRQYDVKRDKISRHKDILNKLGGQVNRLKHDRLIIQKNLQDQVKLQERQQELNVTIDQLHKDSQNARNRIQPLEEEMNRLKQKKRQIIEDKNDQLAESSAKIAELKDDENGVNSIQSSIDSYRNKRRDVEMKKCENKIRELNDDIQTKKEEESKITGDTEIIKQEIANQRMLQRNLSDNLSLRQKEQEIEKLRNEIKSLEEKRGDFDTANLSRQQRDLEKRIEEYKREKNTISGRLSGYVDQIRDKRRELESDELKHADSKLRDKIIEQKTTDLAKHDLEKYYFALDQSIMKYHNLKMDEINKIIRDLWRSTYKGNDIETIEIRSDGDESGQMKTRKTYSYRVVMVKGDKAIDMRGRCSAGQKVLASLIIRMALAETFCINCAILALDEPTTNLDRENIESLAAALVEIIKMRFDQGTMFQLVVITHDEDFVELLGSSDYVDYFYRINRNDEGKSCIEKDDIANLRR